MQEIKFLTGLYLQDIDRNTYVPWLKKNSDKFRIHRNLVVKYKDETITVPKGYITDLSSVPRPLWVFYPPGYSYARKPAAVHDYIYTNLHMKYTKKFADQLYYDGVLAMGMPKWKARIAYLFVRLFGRGSWD